MNLDLFDSRTDAEPWAERLGVGTLLLHHWALAHREQLLADLHRVLAAAPLAAMCTPSGLAMSVTTSSCGELGWVSDSRGYRYEACNPHSGQPWPAMPESFRQLARQAAGYAGFAGFEPDACLINRYRTGARMSLHQDRDERDLRQPIVSLSLGVPALFLLGGMQRSQPQQRLRLEHGDVLVWGGPDRLRFHGVQPIKSAWHPALGSDRINLTWRKAG